MKFFSNIILFLISIIFIKTNLNIPESNKERVRACISLQQKKFLENEKKINEFIDSKSKSYNQTHNKFILLAMAYCFDKMSIELARKIIGQNSRNLNITKLGIEYIYNFENYNYDNQEINRKIYDNFYPSFYAVYKEITDKDKNNSEPDIFNFYFIHTNLFKFFLLYTIINSIIVFYKRLKESDKYIDFTQNNDNKKEKKEDVEEDDSDNDNKKTEVDDKKNKKSKKKHKIDKYKKN